MLLLLAAGVALAVLSFAISDTDSGAEALSLEEYKARCESQLAELCSDIEGVGRCRVMISFAEGEQLEYKGGKLISSSPPRVLGVTVLCRGADSSTVRAQVSELCSALFDIGKNRICVLKLA